MANLTKEQKKNLAKHLYIHAKMTYEEIGKDVGVQRQTVSRWSKEGKWEELKAGMSATVEENIALLSQQLKNINLEILKRDQSNRMATSKEADIIAKITSSISDLKGEVPLSVIITVGRMFINSVRQIDIKKAQEIAVFWDIFVKEKA